MLLGKMDSTPDMQFCLDNFDLSSKQKCSKFHNLVFQAMTQQCNLNSSWYKSYLKDESWTRGIEAWFMKRLREGWLGINNRAIHAEYVSCFTFFPAQVI